MYGDAGRVAAHEERQAEGEGVGERVDGQPAGAETLEVAGSGGADPGVAKAILQEIEGARTGARPLGPQDALAANPGAVVPAGGSVEGQPFADQGAVGVDGLPGGLERVAGAVHETAGRFVEVGVPRRIGGLGGGGDGGKEGEERRKA